MIRGSSNANGDHLIVTGGEAEGLGEGERKECRDDEDGSWVPSHFHNSRATSVRMGRAFRFLLDGREDLLAVCGKKGQVFMGYYNF